ncbi:heat repeat protein [Sporothrix brasiliensis 5110]|uniref:Heat repeat protein n=1 Tax=Sporothrix brasiliensis 5110 TaxID=1398154 RepID=A0A0C2FT24_9PEZI|nr:heat repeat protein [Sporothrix brasiliensis 5110]KIH94133.1 heat repeat protein [Sporothrix brasiliensis 5110]
MDSHPQLAFRNSSTQRSEFFNKLKPCCLEIAKALRKSGGRDADPRETAAAATSMTSQTDVLYGLLTDQVGYDAAVLDASMADYASFPLLTILQHMTSYPARLLENATKCLRVLIQHGWRTSISGENAQRLLILLTTVVTGGRPAGRTDKDKVVQVQTQAFLPEETVAEGYRALAALMKTAGAATAKPGSAESPLVTANAVPVLAHAVSVMLEGVADSIIPTIQIEALGALAALYTTVKDQEALASFLPGTVSGLVRVVAQPGAHKTQKRVVVRTLEVLFAVLVNTLGDLQTRRLQRDSAGEGDKDTKTKKEEPDNEVEEEIISDTVSSSEVLPSLAQAPTRTAEKKQKLGRAWLNATAAQIKLALSSVLKLRNHESEDVRDALQQFCVGLLDECHTSLADSTSILVETAIVTSPTKVDDYGGDTLDSLNDSTAFRSFGPQTTLHHLAMLYPELSDVIKATAYNWATSLPRAMQASDEVVKQRALRNVQKAVAVVEELHLDSTVLQTSLSAALRDSISTLVHASAGSRAAVSEAVSEDAILQLADSTPAGADGNPDRKLATDGSTQLATQSMAVYKPVLLGLGSQKDTRDAVLDLIAHVGPPAQQARLAGDMLDVARDAEGVDQVSAYWLSFELVKAALSGVEDDPDSLLDLSSLNEEAKADAEAVFEDLFSYSVSALAAHSDVTSVVSTADGEADWRVGAIALEVTAYAAARLGEAFRPELIDVLYPIATYLGAPEDRLRAHAVATLNSLASSCGYDSVSALIVDNVDYMLNSVSLRLNTFDISPASTRVLTMMIRLAGARLVPYLDDVVAAIFAALDNYHGYPLFVENLFAVLSEVVQQSVQPSSATQLLEDGKGSKKANMSSSSASAKNRKRRPDPSTTNDLVAILDRRTKRRKELEREAEDDDVEEIGHPRQPWKEAASEADKLLRQHERRRKDGKDGEEKEEEDKENEDDDDDDDAEPTDTNKEGNEVGKPEDPKTPTYALLARITTLTQHYLTAPTPTLRKSLLDLLGTVAPALASADENAFLPLVNAVWPVAVARLYDPAPYVRMAACEALAALCASAGDFLSTRIKAEWHAKLGGWATREKAAAAAKVVASTSTASSTAATSTATMPTRSASPNAHFGERPSVIHIHQRATATRSLSTSQPTGEDQLVPSSSSLSSVSTGLGRFAQAVQIWEALAGLLTAVVTYVKLDDDVYDSILELLLGTSASQSRMLPVSEERRAREALAVVNADAVWLARYRAGQLSKRRDEDAAEDDHDDAWMMATPPVLAGVQFVPLVG